MLWHFPSNFNKWQFVYSRGMDKLAFWVDGTTFACPRRFKGPDSGDSARTIMTAVLSYPATSSVAATE
jgi:hypothetical protein